MADSPKLCPQHGTQMRLENRPDPRFTLPDNTTPTWRCDAGGGHWVAA